MLKKKMMQLITSSLEQLNWLCVWFIYHNLYLNHWMTHRLLCKWELASLIRLKCGKLHELIKNPVINKIIFSTYEEKTFTNPVEIFT